MGHLLEFDVPTMHDWNKGNKLVRDTLSGNGCEETGAGTGSGVRDLYNWLGFARKSAKVFEEKKHVDY